ncbi:MULTISPECIES: amidohydrolase family protein [Micromonospora]|uniref:amidohydrolase family protein n=1 Tax=Micromonospora TaxID=1873 RepID=UPI0005B85CD4|nr:MULTISPECIES: amidohydrolase family protein [Micromonospora]MBC8988811.1 amidohydrolase [Micromonospora chalcea]MCK1804447.1 amidohydrolase [Micromonospora sp. R42106]MCK1829816.1 amidohydrolase [Micromonospora sp. R42003]MCK1841719.1 amidohydrolase [Micromonospora sp. R42004]MCM1018199.1 amidohydrolase [Micromonospora sp. XM-20-01]
MDAIDVHHHIIPDFYAAELRELGGSTVLSGVDRPTWSRAGSLAMMDRQGIRAAIVSLWPGVPPLDRARSRALARRLNEYLAEFVAAGDCRFGAFAVLPFPHLDDCVAEFVHAVDVLGLDGLGLLTNYDGLYVGDRRLDPLLAEAERRRTPIFVHPAVPPATGQPAFGLPLSLYEFPFETVRLVAQLLYNGTLERFPELRIILSHGGGGVSYYADRLTYGPVINRDLADRLPDDPLAVLRRLYFDVAMCGRHALASLRLFADPERVLVGSDYPFMPESFGASIGAGVARHADLDPGWWAAVNRSNAAKLFARFPSTGE